MSLTDKLTTDIDDAAFNQDIKSWANDVKNQLASSASGKTRKGKRNSRIKKTEEGKEVLEKILSKDIKYNIRIIDGTIERIGFSFPRHGVFWAKGVSKSHSVKNPRAKVDWFNSVLERNLPELEDIITNYYADAVVNATAVLIK